MVEALDDRDQGDLCDPQGELDVVIDAWRALPAATRRAVLGMVKAAEPEA
jgi:hypothetical protein